LYLAHAKNEMQALTMIEYGNARLGALDEKGVSAEDHMRRMFGDAFVEKLNAP